MFFNSSFQNWKRENEERNIEKVFLGDIREELKNDIGSIVDDLKTHESMIYTYNSIWEMINKRQQVDSSCIDMYWNFANVQNFKFDNSRFENFKSSGYLRLIENKNLANDLVNLYTNQMPAQIKMNEVIGNERTRSLIKLIETNPDVIDYSGKIKFSKIMNDPKARWHFWYSKKFLEKAEVQNRDLSEHINNVIDEINVAIEKLM